MGYQAQVLNVMIASPSDVPLERRAIRDAVLEWNAIRSTTDKIVLMPIGWESHSSPELGDRPQEIINKQILRDCDLLIAAFWTRIGSPTGKAESGTVEEILEHLERKRPALLYFSNQPVRMDSINSDQFDALKRFKADMKPRGLVEEYDTIEEFRQKLYRHLALTIIRSFGANQTPDFHKGGRERIRDIVVPGVSASAKELLVEISKDQHGIVAQFDVIGGSHLQTNGRDFIGSDEPRLRAKWRGALEELRRQDLVEDNDGKGEIFSITELGFVAADILTGDQ